MARKITNEEIVKDINEINETEFLKKIRAKNRKNLIPLDILERERIAQHIKDLYLRRKPKHDEMEDDIDLWDDVWMMRRMATRSGDEDTPNYRTPLSTVILETIHANIMNVFFTSKDIMRIIPTEAGDIPKIEKLDVFANWSMKNELELFERIDRLFHASGKNGEAPYMISWVKEYGTEIKITPVFNPTNPSEVLIDEDTKEPITQEREIVKLLYNGPRFEVFSRKDYFIPEEAVFGKIPPWEMKRVRFTASDIKQKEIEGETYPDVFNSIQGWGGSESTDNKRVDKEGDTVRMGDTEKMFVLFFGKLRVNAIKTEMTGDEGLEEIEDEFIALMELNTQTLVSLKKNKFPLKMRPTGLDIFIPNDEGRLAGVGVMEFMSGIQNARDLLHNQYMFGTVQSNSPFGFFQPIGNMRNEPIKTKSGFLYPTADPNTVNIVKLPAPDQSILFMIEELESQAQALFGISPIKAGTESKLDPDAPAKKVAIIVQQGDVRLNAIIKRKNKTLKDIFKKWYLLYQANMPPNKFMRIAGEDANNPWKFEPINITDFALKSIPDFELTGNILNSNKALEAQKKLSIYQILIGNPFFNPQTREGLQALHALTKWLIDGLDEIGISNFLPPSQGEQVRTPEEENARFLQGDDGIPSEGEDHINHLRVHGEFVLDPSLPDEVRQKVVKHIQRTGEMLRNQITQQQVLGNLPQQGGQGGVGNRPTPQATGNVLPEQGLGGLEAGVGANL
jgi:hypothetical protein